MADRQIQVVTMAHDQHEIFFANEAYDRVAVEYRTGRAIVATVPIKFVNSYPRINTPPRDGLQARRICGDVA